MTLLARDRAWLARGVVVLPHASAAGRFESSHRFGAELLEQAGLGTLQVDLLTPAEEAALAARGGGEAQVAMLAERLATVLDWLRNQADTSRLAVGMFASRAEAAASLIAAESSGRVVAIVSKGGVADLTQREPTHLTGPTLLLLGPTELARAAELAPEFFGRHLV